MSKKFIPAIPDEPEIVYEKDGKIHYPFSNKSNKTKPEEYVRALWTVKLIKEYKYNPTQIDFEVRIPSGQTEKKKPADIVVFKSKNTTNLTANSNIVIEVKKKDRSDGFVQMQTYLFHLLLINVLIWPNLLLSTLTPEK
jgi:hypothetical protein